MKAIRYILFLVLMGLAICFTACQTDGEYTPSMGRVTPVKAEFLYKANPDARVVVEYAGVEVYPQKAYIKEDNMRGLLRVYRFENEDSTLDVEEQVNISPVVIRGTATLETYSAIPLIQMVANSPVQLPPPPPAPAPDSSCIALQFFYGDPAQPEEVKITILAIDQYSLLMKSYNLNNVHDTMKAEVGEITLCRGELSERVVLNFYRFKHPNPSYDLASKFYYKISNPTDGNILQDYKAASLAANAAEIKPESAVRNKIPYAIYKSAIMRFTYKDTSMKFASPTELLKGEKW